MFGPTSKSVLPGLSLELHDFILKAKNLSGIVTVTAIGGSEYQFNEIMSYQNGNSEGKFDSLWLEYEYWNNKPRDLNRFLQLLDYMHNIGGGLTVGAYLGWPLGSEVSDIAKRVDRLFIHCYVDNGNKTFDFCRNRLSWFGSLELPLDVWPLFSAEWRPEQTCNKRFSYPNEPEPSCFMGPWLGNHGFSEAEDLFLRRYQNEQADWKRGLTIKGFYYFAYSHAKRYISTDVPLL